MDKLPKGWEHTTIGTIARVDSGVGFPKKFQGKITGEYPVYKVGDISKSFVRKDRELISSEFYVDEQTKNEMKGRLFVSGSTVFAKIGEALRLERRMILGKDGLADNNVMSAKCYDDELDYFVYLFLKSIRLGVLSRSSTVPSIRKSDVEYIALKLPPLKEAKRIESTLQSVLGQVDTIQTRLDRLPALIKRFRQSVLAAAVSGQLTEAWRKEQRARNATEDETNDTTQTPDPLVPTQGVGTRPIPSEECVRFGKSVTIGDLALDIRYGTSKKCSYGMGKVPVLRIPNIGSPHIDMSDLKYADFEEKEIDKLALQVGDILLIRSNGSPDLVAKAAVITPKELDCLFAGYLIRLRLNLEKCVPDFIHMVLSSPQMRQIVELQARSTSGVNNINSKELAALSFILPSTIEQTEVVKRVHHYFSIADTLETHLTQARERVAQLTQSILAKAFRGELVSQDDKDEPADQLLARIATARAEAEALEKATKKAARAGKAKKATTG